MLWTCAINIHFSGKLNSKKNMLATEKAKVLLEMLKRGQY